jgi:hypothetical protein
VIDLKRVDKLGESQEVVEACSKCSISHRHLCRQLAERLILENTSLTKSQVFQIWCALPHCDDGNDVSDRLLIKYDIDIETDGLYSEKCTYLSDTNFSDTYLAFYFGKKKGSQKGYKIGWMPEFLKKKLKK